MTDQESVRRQAQSAAHAAKEHFVASTEAAQKSAEAEAEAERWTSHMGRRGQHIADAIGAASERLRGQEDWLAEGAESMSRHLARLSETARSKHPAELKADVEQFARERPAVFLAAAVATGLALGRVLRSSAASSDSSAPANATLEAQRSAPAGHHGENRSI